MASPGVLLAAFALGIAVLPFGHAARAADGAACTTAALPVTARKAPAKDWELVLGGKGSDFGSELRFAPDGAILLVGGTGSKGAGLSDAWIMRLSPEGKVLSEKTLGGPGDEIVYGGTPLADGGMAFVGFTSSKGHGGKDLWVVRLDAAGNAVWDRANGGQAHDLGHGIAATRDGGLVAVGHNESMGAGGADAWIIRLDAKGRRQWDRVFGGPKWEMGFDVVETLRRGYMVAGFAESFGAGKLDGLLLHYSPGGRLLWWRTYGGPADDQLFGITASPCGGYLLTGYSKSGGLGGADAWLVRVDDAGRVIWEARHGGAGDDRAWTAVPMPDGGFVINARTGSRGTPGQALWLFRIDAAGTLLWERVIGGAKKDIGFRLYQGPAGGWFVLGETTSRGAGKHDLWLVKLSVR